jgi:hypothetical protein
MEVSKVNFIKKIWNSARDFLREKMQREPDAKPAGKVISTRRLLRRLRKSKTGKKALRKAKTKEKAKFMYPPGTKIAQPSGTHYTVATRGNWIRTSLKKGEQKEICEQIRTTSNQESQTSDLPSSSLSPSLAA